MTDIADIKPDTSLYATMPERLRAMALILEGRPGDIQIKNAGVWFHSLAANTERVANLFTKACDYRIKPEPPKPRELWKLAYDKGYLAGDFASKGMAETRVFLNRHDTYKELSIVRFVEQL